MSDRTDPLTDPASEAAVRGEIVLPDEEVAASPGDGEGDGDGPREAVSEPAKVMRVGSMIKQLLDEVRSTDLDEPSRERVREIYETSVHELASALSPDLRDELERLSPPFAEDEVPSEAELRVAKAQLVGWLEGLFHGIQATLFAQQMAARQQLDGMRGQLPPGVEPPEQARPSGQYL
ncbi:MAG: bacterial proteasome activator family protein [Acidimicrobiales bacterium]|nr:bacterial proteasome activator family protein [Acidimicrobiales bacterium]MCB9373628.1 bacterial proteasome activator family protein [Microthrixaceae bacterium]